MPEQKDHRMNRQLRKAIIGLVEAAKHLEYTAEAYMISADTTYHHEFGAEGDIGHRYYQTAVELRDLAVHTTCTLESDILMDDVQYLEPDTIEELLLGVIPHLKTREEN